MRLGLFAAIIIGSILFLGYTRTTDNSISLTTPKGWAAPIPMDKGSWKERLAGIEQNAQAEPLFILEMAQEPTPEPTPKKLHLVSAKVDKKSHKKGAKLGAKSKRKFRLSLNQHKR